METNIVLYNSYTLKDIGVGAVDLLDEIIDAGFSTLVLGALHVNIHGDLLWNETELVIHKNGIATFDPHRSFGGLNERLDHLISANTIKHIFWSIGGGGFRDFSNIAHLLKTVDGTQKLKAGFEALHNALPLIKGYDFNNEDHHDTDTVVWLTEFLAISLNAMITYRPYFGQVFWEDCLEIVYTRLQKQPVLWWNLQCYEEGKINVPQDWAHSIALRQEYNGVADANSYIIPGYSIDDIEDVSPAVIQQFFSSYQGSVGGGFITRITGLNESKPYTLATYAQSIRDGLLTVTEDVSSHDYD